MAVAVYQQTEMDRRQYKEHRDLHEQETSGGRDGSEAIRASVV
jgi:hypothetical protein